ncbi:hypothetical protein [Paenibacillus sp. GXUN7292]|uniref:hypothetical protein n=1 Tax=Paenibacillus sp. GXUN7292 TaxID=3422499 RepID=UPI003D7E79E4
MIIDDYIGLVVVVELDTGATHEGVLEESQVYGYVKIINGSEMFQLPRKEIVDIKPIAGVRFKL